MTANNCFPLVGKSNSVLREGIEPRENLGVEEWPNPSSLVVI